MIYLILAVTYLCAGFGFALSSWLQSAEERTNAGEKVTLDLSMWVLFICAWPVIAIYCYRSEVSKTVKSIDQIKAEYELRNK